ncbi:MtrAB system histidine kinase MtrB [Corynebacterium sp. UMB4614]|uniref:MtrAB system histidine kinase MtrB n=1 Tax=Corynebacterium sp. UMB4614 TaxID=3046334 RepID=UPI002550EE73|nr:MtrAB system histidine kinase MtrB [Corynebacterium sp. UMB4614]MDK7134391.1 MtrAB system histidine kinase MtrB [Corynebacterium sp. UMB4614]
MPNPVPPNGPAEPDALTDTESRRPAGSPVRADGVGSALTAGVDRVAQPGESASPAASAGEGVPRAEAAVAGASSELEVAPESGPERPTWRSALRHPAATAKSLWYRLLFKWRTSIQVRVIGSVFLSSVLVILALGFVLISFLNQQLLNAKYSSATEEIHRARATVEEQIAATDTSNPLPVRLSAARAVLADSGSTAKANSAVYEPVLMASSSAGDEVRVPQEAVIPTKLRNFVQQGQVSYQYTTMTEGTQTFKALVIGTPVASDVSGIELYLVMPLDAEENTLNLMRGLLLAGAIVLLVLLVVIAWVFAQQLTVPVRSASRIAERFAAGHLRERMVVDGQDEVARLSISFNEMAESLSAQIRNLEEFGSLQRQFTSDVSHELRTPLTTVRMAADLIKDNAENLDPLTARAAELMDKELDRFEMLLGDLLEISRHDAGQANLSAEKIDMRGVVHSALAQVRGLAEDLGVEFRLDLPEEPVTAEVDSRRVERILRNLLANAVDHSEGHPVEVALAATERNVAITVTDHGVGLNPGEEEMVFNRFWRSDPSRERRTGGTGLGLAIAREDAKLHGGVLDAIGEPGVGSCFRLTVPRKAGSAVGTSPLPLVVTAAIEHDADEPAHEEPQEDVRRAEESEDSDTQATGANEAPALGTSADQPGEQATDHAPGLISGDDAQRPEGEES